MKRKLKKLDDESDLPKAFSDQKDEDERQKNVENEENESDDPMGTVEGVMETQVSGQLPAKDEKVFDQVKDKGNCQNSFGVEVEFGDVGVTEVSSAEEMTGPLFVVWGRNRDGGRHGRSTAVGRVNGNTRVGTGEDRPLDVAGTIAVAVDVIEIIGLSVVEGNVVEWVEFVHLLVVLHGIISGGFKRDWRGNFGCWTLKRENQYNQLVSNAEIQADELFERVVGKSSETTDQRS